MLIIYSICLLYVSEALCHGCNIPEWLFKIIFWLGYCNSMMNPIIYACSSREFKRAFIRILRCRWRRKPRTFVDDTTSFASHTEMNKIDRFPTLRRLTHKESSSILRRSKRGCTGNRILLQTSSTRRRLEKESPIASLKLLQRQQRKDTVDTVETIMSDDESMIQGELSDDEKSDISSEPPQHALLDNKKILISHQAFCGTWTRNILVGNLNMKSSSNLKLVRCSREWFTLY